MALKSLDADCTKAASNRWPVAGDDIDCRSERLGSVHSQPQTAQGPLITGGRLQMMILIAGVKGLAACAVSLTFSEAAQCRVWWVV
eukprot:131253-Pelagomonas_calceolata.AAC.2